MKKTEKFLKELNQQIRAERVLSNSRKFLDELNQLLNYSQKIDLIKIPSDQYDNLKNYSLVGIKKFLLLLSHHVNIPPPGVYLYWQSSLGFRIRRVLAHYNNGMIRMRRFLDLDGKIIAAILVHEFCHYYVDVKDIRIEGKSLNENERLIDLIAILLGFGQILINGKFRKKKEGSVHVGYLGMHECLMAYSDFGEINKISREELYKELDVVKSKKVQFLQKVKQFFLLFK